MEVKKHFLETIILMLRASLDQLDQDERRILEEMQEHQAEHGKIVAEREVARAHLVTAELWLQEVNRGEHCPPADAGDVYRDPRNESVLPPSLFMPNEP